MQSYDANPTSFVYQKIRYEDLIYLKQTFAEENVPYYLNTFSFLEDRAYGRDSSLLLGLFSQEYKDGLMGALADFDTQTSSSLTDSNDPIVQEYGQQYENSIADFKSNFDPVELEDALG